MPDLDRLEEVRAIDMRTVPRDDRARIGKAKAAAASAIPLLRSALFPEDD